MADRKADAGAALAEEAWIELGGAWGGLVAVRVDAAAPGATGVALIEPGAALMRLHPDERAAAAGLPAARRRDWAAGRLALRSAVERGEMDDATVTAEVAALGPIGADDRGAPRLPPGWVGSISHKRGLAVGFAQRDDGWKLGVDVELDEPSKVDIERRVLTPKEREALTSLTDPLARGRAVMLRFAVKEAVYKAIDPWVRRYVGFQEVEVTVGARGAVVVQSELELEIDAAWTRWHGCLLAVARARG